MKIYIPRENKIAEQPQGFQFVGYDFCFTGACGSEGYLNIYLGVDDAPLDPPRLQFCLQYSLPSSPLR